MISGFCHEVDEICALQGYYTVYGGNSLPTFRDNLQVSSWRVKKVGLIGCPKMSVRNYHHMLHNIQEECRSLLTA